MSYAFLFAHYASTLNCRPNVIFEIVILYVFVWTLSGTKSGAARRGR
jgi:hypothetical protein